MTDYTNYIEDTLNRLMPQQILMEKNETETPEKTVYVKDAPKVKGYFKFISIRYMKRMRDIKKMCIEYINTYVESCLNVAKNMDDVNIIEEQDKDTLAKELDFSKMGANTNGEKKSATTKEGVLFLTGDKALMDKINAIIEKINLRAKKNKMLMEWASLMIVQSKIIANDIVRKETTKLLKDEKKQKEQERKNEEKKKKEQAKFEADEKAREAAQKANSVLASEYGEPDEGIKKAGLDKKTLKAMFGKIKDGNLSKAFTNDDDKLDDSNEINKARIEFYTKMGADKTVDDAITFAIDGDNNETQHFKFATYMVENCDLKKDTIPCPIDIMIATANSEAVLKSIAEKVRKPIDGIKADMFKSDNIDAKDALEDKYTKMEYTHKCAYLYLSIISNENAILESAGSIYTTAQFIAEQNLETEKAKLEDYMLISDVLSDYDYQLNIEPHRFKNGIVDFIKLDDNGNPVFYNGLYHKGNIVELSDEELHEIAYFIINNY